ncbi:MAG: hypothetical protein HY738_01660 [Bacteroidia bacterium]|nr:hypothetical protein [Bacteroidia bacterium]
MNTSKNNKDTDLRKLSKKELSDWNLVNGGIGFEWSSINYDISLKSILEENAIFTMLKSTIRRTYKKAEIA